MDMEVLNQFILYICLCIHYLEEVGTTPIGIFVEVWARFLYCKIRAAAGRLKNGIGIIFTSYNICNQYRI